ncbi:MAG: hypothetical protein KDH91_11220 [Rhodoferax sp.]|nr:hypothetical protein [Rhodoferax sp.]MCW5631478.1 hypothetical protein [Rhodoferax sp.]
MARAGGHRSLMRSTAAMRLLALFLLLPLAGCATLSPESAFWDWFQSRAADLKAVKQSDAPIMDTLHQRLHAVHAGLTYEMSLHDGPVRELIISGDGLVALVPVVHRLTAAAPNMDGWKVTAFRPRMPNFMGYSLTFGEDTHDLKSIWMYPIVDGDHFDLILYHPQYREEERGRFTNALYVALDMALGEFDVMTGIRHIDFQKLPENPEQQGLLPFARLREVFDNFYSRRGR